MADEVNVLDLTVRELLDHVDRAWDYVINDPDGTPCLVVLPLAHFLRLREKAFNILCAHAMRVGLPGVTSYGLRHTAAKLRRDAGASVKDGGAFLGVRSLYMTSRYLARLEGERDLGCHGVAEAMGVR